MPVRYKSRVKRRCLADDTNSGVIYRQNLKSGGRQNHLRSECRDFPGGPVVKKLHGPSARRGGSIPDQGTRFHMTQLKPRAAK